MHQLPPPRWGEGTKAISLLVKKEKPIINMPNIQPQSDDFFKLLAEDQKRQSPQNYDEIVFRDTDGHMKVLKGGAILDYNQGGKAMPAAAKAFAPAAAVNPVAAPAPPRRVVPPVLPAMSRPLQDVPSVRLPDWEGKAAAWVSRLPEIPPTPEGERRLKNLVLSYLKNVRNLLEIKEALLLPPQNGGLGYEAAAADKIISLLRQETAADEPPASFQTPRVMPADLAAAAKDSAAALGAVAMEGAIFNLPPAKAPMPVKPLPLRAEPISLRPVTAVKFSAPSAPPAPKPLPATELKPAKPAAAVSAPPAPPAWSQKFRPQPPQPVIADIVVPKAAPELTPAKITAVKYQSKLVSPVEEIRQMKLVDFRRLAPVPADAAKKIMDKIDQLENESFAKRNEAIKAWKQNEISRLYLDLGEQGMEEKKTMAEVIAERLQGGKATLTEAEVDAVIELNQKLRY